jgi:nuclear transport factor 2 (NTF2) superfamily protein
MIYCNMDFQKLIRNVYSAFNRRDIDSVLATFHLDVKWPNGWEGGFVFGHNGVRDYWTRQWGEINPYVVPLSITELEDGRVQVDVQQTVKDLSGNLLMEGKVRHVYTFEDGLVRTMEIVKLN